MTKDKINYEKIGKRAVAMFKKIDIRTYLFITTNKENVTIPDIFFLALIAEMKDAWPILDNFKDTLAYKTLFLK